MKLENHKIRYDSMEEAMDAMCMLVLMLEGLKHAAECGDPCPEDFYRNVCHALDLMQDVSLLGDGLAAGLQPDGSVELAIDDYAWKLMAENGALPQ